ncbi:hypothetical protein O0S08_08270 [Nannocystis poenicansa]|uniref:Uncharacterized protein n=1 Tax=Nannocystis punicea TaxID=2995304 RepID=A0ABY7HA76_9BACT|nr:hypothetical protein [Nannocystis poenicansa]WAS96143.1 hypothetical protein O0S08_08270 [Nannocystis poenicansa]
MPAAPRDHVLGGDAGAVDDALGVDVEVPVDLERVALEGVAGLEVAGDVEQDVDAAHDARGLVEHGLPGDRVAHVEAATVGPLARPAARGGEVPQRLQPDVGGEHGVAGREQDVGGVTTDAAGTSGDEKSLWCEHPVGRGA